MSERDTPEQREDWFMRRFLAIERIPQGMTNDGFRDTLRRLDASADQLGVRVTETIYNLDRHQAFSVFEAADETQVREAHAAAGLDAPDVFAAELVYTELLLEPRRQR